MSLRSTLSRKILLEEGTPDEVIQKKRGAVDEQVRPARLEVAGRTGSGRRSRTISFPV